MEYDRIARYFVQSKQSLVEAKIACKVTEQQLTKGRKRYSSFGDHYSWSKDDYSYSGFCATYFWRRFYSRAMLVRKIFQYCQSEKMLPSDLFEKHLKVVSFGCGPGGDLVGFQSFCREEIFKECLKSLHMSPGVRKSRRRKKRLRKRMFRAQNRHKYWNMFRNMNAWVCYVGYDSSRKWRKYLDALGYPFQKQMICTKFVKAMEPADIAILCYFSHAANLHTLTFLNRCFWRSLTEKCRLVLVIDTPWNDKELDTILGCYGFKKLPNFFYENHKRVYATLWSRPPDDEEDKIWFTWLLIFLLFCVIVVKTAVEYF